ncbi:MAG: biopolymer transporter ExbD [Verrucomicrobia bacterium]|nr:biopolymer transporter ExbD [Verrucomicrobiota bacterium]
MNFRKQSKQESVGFQIAPMIDVVFLLLCFFVTSQIFSQWETEIDITLPTAKTGQTPQRLPGEIIINILADGSAIVNGRNLDDDSMDTMLKRLAGVFPGQPVLLRADKATAYEHVIKVLDLCRQADIWNISFATGVPEE